MQKMARIPEDNNFSKLFAIRLCTPSVNENLSAISASIQPGRHTAPIALTDRRNEAEREEEGRRETPFPASPSS